jgi:hypothetical protein
MALERCSHEKLVKNKGKVGGKRRVFVGNNPVSLEGSLFLSRKQSRYLDLNVSPWIRTAIME